MQNLNLKSIKTIIQAIQDETHVELRWVGEEREPWDTILRDCPYIPIHFDHQYRVYNNQFYHDLSEEFQDCSFLLLMQGHPVGIMALTAFKKKGAGWSLHSSGGPIRGPVFKDGVTSAVKKTLSRTAFEFVLRLAKFFEIHELPMTERLMTAGMSPFAQAIEDSGADLARSQSVTGSYYVDLSLPMDQIKSHFRKSYRSLINKGQKLWNVTLSKADSANSLSTLKRFQELHKEVSGRVTRSQATWDHQWTAIERKNAFLITLDDQDGKMVGGAYINFSKDEGMYATGAYDRSLFELPLGHVVQMAAIEELVRLEVRWYWVGYRATMDQSDKIKQISKFSSGFASHEFINLNSTLQLK